MDVLWYSEVFFFSCSFTVNHIDDITSVQFPVFNNHLYNQNFQSWTFHSVTSLLLLGKKHSSANWQLITERLHCYHFCWAYSLITRINLLTPRSLMGLPDRIKQSRASYTKLYKFVNWRSRVYICLICTLTEHFIWYTHVLPMYTQSPNEVVASWWAHLELVVDWCRHALTEAGTHDEFHPQTDR